MGRGVERRIEGVVYLFGGLNLRIIDKLVVL
jgi:hypothetical protein